MRRFLAIGCTGAAVLAVRICRADPSPANGATPLPAAADLVREVRVGEQWIHHVHSLQVTFSEVDRRSDISIAALTAAIEKQSGIPDPKINMRLRPTTHISTTLLFDGTHCSMDTHAEEELFSREWLWNGTAAHEYYCRKGRTGFMSIMPKAYFSPFEWLPADGHVFAWTNLDRAIAVPEPEVFVTLGREKFRGIDCWKLMTTQNEDAWPTRWFVGIADDRLYGVWDGWSGDPSDEVAMFREIAGPEGFQIDTVAQCDTWFENLSEEKQAAVREQEREWVGRHGMPSEETWFADYVQLQPRIWFAKRYGSQTYSTQKADGTEGGPALPDFMREITATDVRLDEKIPEKTFDLTAMKIPDGTRVWDITHGPALDYKYKEKFTADEWQAIVDAAEKRDLAQAKAVTVQQQTQAVQAAQEEQQRRNPFLLPKP